MSRRSPLAILCLTVAVLAGVPAACEASWTTVNSPIDPSQLTKLTFGTRSYWLQPWRSSLTTRPATALRDAIGINFDVTSAEAASTARLLGDSGFKRARLEIPWNAMSYANPSQVANPAYWTADITALRNNGIRPLILLNANHGGPTPMKTLNLTLTQPAAQGATTVSLDSASAAKVAPGLTGINVGGMAAGVLITQVDAGGVATLSRPLPIALTAGPAPATTLRFAPFAPPYLADGNPNPLFEQTLAGWLTYVKGVAQLVRNTYGSDDFDVEVWNEMGFGSNFLYEGYYFSPVPDPGSTGNVTDALLQRTIQMLRDPTNGLTDVKIGDGFTNQSPWGSGATVLPGTDAIDKHPYFEATRYPAFSIINGIRPLDAAGNPSYTTTSSGANQDLFTPNFLLFMPEYFLTAVQTETLMRDLSPIQTTIYGVPHGAGTHPPGSPPPTMWITEDNLDANQAHTVEGMPAVYEPEFQAKTALRFFTSYASAGAQAIDLFAAKGGVQWQLIPQGFFDTVDASPSSYPASQGGQTMQAVGRLAATLTGAQTISSPRQLTLDAIADSTNKTQFTGDGTAAHPSLYDRDVLAFFPFQVSQHRFVSAVYVMSRDLAHLYTSTPAPGATPYDMPEETFRLTLGNVDGNSATVSLTDPLTGAQRTATIISRDASHIVVELPVTDSPRMLTIDDAPPGAAPPTTPVPAPTTPDTPPTAPDAPPAAPPADQSPPADDPITVVDHGSTSLNGLSDYTSDPPTSTSHTVVSFKSPPSAQKLTLMTTANVAAATVMRQGIKLAIRCRTSCAVRIVAAARAAGAARGQVLSQVNTHARSGATVQLTLRLTAAGRTWLRTAGSVTVRITAATDHGATASKVIRLTRPHRAPGR